MRTSLPGTGKLVRELWLLLRRNGVDARWDGLVAQQPRDWALWTAEQIREADQVLVIASAAYRERAEASVGRRVQWEARLVRDAFHADPHRLDRFLPVVLPGQPTQGVPDFLAPNSSTVYTVEEFTPAGAEPLLRFLLGLPEEVEPGLGGAPDFPTRAHRSSDTGAPPSGAVADPNGAGSSVSGC
ncbi:hypothetical protein GCM10022243_17290 [Saccharothrix violaceirubra]|uniref:SEFIR domain-containing protein n=1 Tax=Saccharothrix violaceirubra TaxID=413306 RepID=A0A7W7SYX4_9PSEU|nr:toll/interleukin-1 receptor domain-containing protein [Saccharothrix violaceirubra]MBB4963473.1 hypothetical protein [Saccharothrix violaceirubra]